MLLPPEIFDLIIDAVAAEQWTSVVKTCSLVCQYFHARARIHLFSQICLCFGIEKHCRRRARKFLSILKYKKNSDLISRCIRSVKIVVHRLYPDIEYWTADTPCSLGWKHLLKLVGIYTNPLEEVLTKFKHAPIEELIIKGAYNMSCKFPNLRIYGTVLLAMMCSNPNLKTLRVEKLRDFPFRFITGSSSHGGGFTRLALRGVTVSDYWCRIQPRIVVLTGIETLELVHMSSDQISKVLHQLSPPPKSDLSPKDCLPNLKNLVISLPQLDFEERVKVWNVILVVAGTLESLELCLSTAHLDRDMRPLCLNPLKSLQRLKIRTSIHKGCCAHALRGELALMAMILASSASALRIRSIILETSFGVLPDRQAWQETSSILNPDMWLAIDAILASSKFVDLRMVEVTVNGSPASVQPGEGFLDLGEMDFQALLPTISQHSRMSLTTSATLDSRKQTAVYELYPIDRDI